ncbi:glycosyltransferase family 9 protein [Mesonia aestuariivivens]|uniref:Lipopolysaccharide heptosyltransferase family protein n=1 Tax=Mesonia aestuariivivens TaxID=2796128 RepID=A0ABS6W0K6_9FLAO|nr:glycosyltransferase family 9 protein [Mesonia aestuariivivens]MBW2961390.1 lipopolysaccharide heptosyltransferase family protein [Mesonia aestuariivivens]
MKTKLSLQTAKYLIIQQKMIGDVLTSSIICEAIKQKNPASEVHFLVNVHTTPVIENNPFIDKEVVMTKEIEKSPTKLFHFLQQIKRDNYDVVIDVYSKPVSVLIAKFSKAQLKIGYKKWYSKLVYNELYTYKTKADTNAGLAVENRMNLLQSLDHSYPVAIKPKIYLTEKEITSARKILHQENLLNKPLFMIGVLGSSEEKSYPLSYLAEVLNKIIETTGAELLFNYIPKQKETVERLIKLCKLETQHRIHYSIYGKSLREFMALTSLCSAFIGNEGGAVNMAKALEVPTFSIFAPFTKRAAWSLYENNKNVSVHLEDYYPENYKKYNLKEIREEASSYYKMFKAEFFLKKLESYLKNIL